MPRGEIGDTKDLKPRKLCQSIVVQGSLNILSHNYFILNNLTK